jgi:hypothetical protein
MISFGKSSTEAPLKIGPAPPLDFTTFDLSEPSFTYTPTDMLLEPYWVTSVEITLVDGSAQGEPFRTMNHWYGQNLSAIK